MRALILLATVACTFVSQIAAAQAAADPVMMQADAAFTEALGKADKSALEALLDSEFQWTSATGKTETRAEILKNKSVPPAILTSLKDAQGNSAEVKGYTYGDLGNVQLNLGRAHVLRVWVKRTGASGKFGGWKAIVYQEVMALAAPPTVTPGAGKECENPCKMILFTPKSETEGQVAAAYSKLETAAHARNSAGFAPMVADEFVAASSNSDRLQTKQSRIQQFDSGKDAGVAPTPLLSARMFTFKEAVLMISEHKPVQGNPLHVTRFWIKRGGSWVSTLSYQTAVTAAP